MNAMAHTTRSAPITRWDGAALAALNNGRFAQTQALGAVDVQLVSDTLDVWDAWPLAAPDGTPVAWRGGELWFALTVARSDDPEQRHHLARIHHFHRIGDRFAHIGQTLPEGFGPGTHEWSGSARFDAGRATLFYTATGHPDDPAPSYRQRIFATDCAMAVDGDFGAWSAPVEIVAADGHIYRPASESSGEPGKIKAFRDPSHFRDSDGQDYIMFTASSAVMPGAHDGVIGLAVAGDDGTYRPLPPLIEATGVNNELERPHIVRHDGRLYLFWSTQRGVFAPGIFAPTGLYGATAETLHGPWTLLNGHGLVFGNPVVRPTQAYSWWVLPDLSVASFVDYWGPEVPDQPELATRRARFGGTFAPFVHIGLDGDRASLIDTV